MPNILSKVEAQPQVMMEYLGHPGDSPDVHRNGLFANQDANTLQVTDFLLKRGYNRTERVFREESRNINDEGRPIPNENTPFAPQKYQKAFDLLKNWVDNNLSVYKVIDYLSLLAHFWQLLTRQ
jgi:hypothetical protein